MNEELLKVYSENPKIMKVIDLAFDIEEEYARGITVADDLDLMATLNDKTGYWEFSFEVEHGHVFFTGLDPKLSKIEIISIPKKEYILNYENMPEEEAQKIRFSLSKSMIVDMNSVQSLKEVKEYFKDDFVMSNIKLLDEKADNVARMLV